MRHKLKNARPATKRKMVRTTKTAKPSRSSRAKRLTVLSRSAVRPGRKKPKRPSLSQTVPQKSRNPKRPKPKLAAAVSPDAASIQAALDLLTKAQAEMTARGVDLLAVAHELGRNAAQALKASLLESLVADQLLPDLQRLHSHLGSGAGPSKEFQLLAEATLNWFARHFDLSEHLEAGQLLEIPASHLERYDFDGPLPDTERALVQVQVQSPGWKCRSQIIIPPKVAVAGPIANSTTKTAEAPPPNNPF